MSADTTHSDPPSDSIAELYQNHHAWLYGWLRKKLGCADNAADVAHDTFMRIITSRNALLGSSLSIDEPRAYLTTTAKRLLVDRARRKLLEETYLAEMAFAAETIPGYPSPEEILIALQALEQISLALERVSAKAREAFLLHYLEGQTHAMIASHLGVSTKMIQKYLIQSLLQYRTIA